MKKTFAKNSLQMLVTLLLIVGGVVFTAQRAQAQALTLTPAAGQSVNWYNETQAIGIVEARINQLHGFLAGTPVGSPTYIDWYRQAAFYKAVRTALLNGVSTGQAINAGLKAVNSNGGDVNAEPGFNYSANKSQLQALYLDAKNRLS